MSRSLRHTPKRGITTADSETSDKRIAARKERARICGTLKPHLADEDLDLPAYREHPKSGQWRFGKDGKFYFAGTHGIDVKKAMRK